MQIFQKSLIDQDDISCVLSLFQHAVTLLTDEVASQDQPGPIVLYFATEAILDTFFVWSLSCPEYATELKYHQLRCFEFLLSRTQQEVLFHKQIVNRPASLSLDASALSVVQTAAQSSSIMRIVNVVGSHRKTHDCRAQPSRFS